MPTRKAQQNTLDSIKPGRSAKYPRQFFRAGKKQRDIRMRSPSPQHAHDSSLSPDRDRTLINRENANDDEWTDDEPASTDDDAYFQWEEEATLFSDLLEEATPEPNDAKLIALAESLQKPFDEESRQIKREIARTFVPLVNRVKGVYASLERTADIPFGAGLLTFNDACKETEKATASDVYFLQKIHIEHQTRINGILQQLEEEYAYREQLWANFKKNVDDLVDPVLEMLHEAPARLERTIASIERQGKAIDKESASASADVAELTLKDLLSKLA